MSDTRQRLQLRAGAQLFVVSSDELQIAAVNHSTTFTSVPVVSVVAALCEALQNAPTRAELAATVVERLRVETALVEYAIDLMLQTGCLVLRGADAPELDARGRFYAAVGLDPEATARTLSAARPLLVAATASATVMLEALADVGVQAEPVVVREGSSCGAALEKARAGLESSLGPIVVWDVPWRMPFARLLNDLAIERGRPVLFGVCEGAIGRLGPYVLPRNTACLECVQSRVLTNSGDNEVRVAQSYRTRLADRVPEPMPSHPAFRRAIASLLAVELSQILLLRPPVTLGGYVELVFGEAQSRRRPALKVPRCPACHPARPPRLAWDANFPAPLVKSGSA